MNKKFLFALWGCLFILCAACGFIPEPAGAYATAMRVLSLCFFLPPALLLHRAVKEQDIATVKLIRSLSLLSLLLSMVLIIANFLTAYSSEILGTILYYVLVIVSSPMICSGNWAMSLFFWSCLLMVSLHQLRKK